MAWCPGLIVSRVLCELGFADARVCAYLISHVVLCGISIAK